MMFAGDVMLGAGGRLFRSEEERRSALPSAGNFLFSSFFLFHITENFSSNKCERFLISISRGKAL